MLTCEQLRAARAILRWRAVDLVEKTGVSLSTIQRAEKADGPVPMIGANEKAIRQAFETAGVEFIPENDGGAGVRMRKPGTQNE